MELHLLGEESICYYCVQPRVFLLFSWNAKKPLKHISCVSILSYLEANWLAYCVYALFLNLLI